MNKLCTESLLISDRTANLGFLVAKSDFEKGQAVLI
jgi:hypothetical protein